MAKTAKKTEPDLWEKVKREVAGGDKGGRKAAAMRSTESGEVGRHVWKGPCALEPPQTAATTLAPPSA